MKNVLILEGKRYISAGRAAIFSGYTSDYIGQLCRSEKLECKMIGRSWFVTAESLIKHRSSTNPDLNLNVNLNLIQTQTPETEKEIEKIFFVPDIFSLPHYISGSFLASPSYPRSKIISATFTDISITLTVLFISFIFLFQSLQPIKNTYVLNYYTASVISVAEGIVSKVFSFFSNMRKIAKPKDAYNGFAIVPSTDSPSQNEAMKQKIKNSFSDEVAIKPDQSGTAGIITPIFKKAKGDDFIYVLVPVKEDQK